MDNDFIAQTAARFGIPGAAVAVFHDGREHHKQLLKVVESESYSNGIQKLVYDVVR